MDQKAGRKRLRILQNASLLSLFSRCAAKRHAVLLDSSQYGPHGRYSIMGTAPFCLLESRAGVLYRRGKPSRGSLLPELSAALRQDDPIMPELPIESGAIGFLTYEYGRRLMGLPVSAVPWMPEACFLFFDGFAVQDHQTGRLYLIANGKTQPAEALLDQMERDLEKGEAPAPPLLRFPALWASADCTKGAYLSAVQSVIDHARVGDLYVANLTQQLHIRSAQPPWPAYLQLRRQNPVPYGCYWNGGSWQILCASMEEFLTLREGRVITRPIKGTRPRGHTPETDRAMRQELLHSVKDRSELVMVTDLERNDLNRVCQTGSVHASTQFSIESYASVHQMISTITGTLAKGRDCADLLRAAFPGGSITGAPKYRAMEILDGLEAAPRGLYTGAIGYLSSAGNAAFNIVIRTAVRHQGCYHIGAGGGVTAESDPEAEYREMLHKASSVLGPLCGASSPDWEELLYGNHAVSR